MAIAFKVFTVTVSALLALNGITGGMVGNPSVPGAIATEQAVVAVRNAVAPEGAPVYRVVADLDPVRKRLTGQERVRWTNTTDQPQSILFLRTYGVEAYYGPVTFTEMKVNANPVTFTLDWTLLRVPLSTPLAPGASLDLEFSFAAELPVRFDPATYNPGVSLIGAEYGANFFQDVITLSDAIPRVLQPPADGSSPSLALVPDSRLDALWQVTLTAPAEWTVVSSGLEERQETLADGRSRWQMAAGRSTVFSMVAGKDLKQATRETAAGTVNAYYPAAAEAAGQDVADRAAAVLELYADRFGPLFEQEIDLVAVPAAGWGGTYNGGGLIFLTRRYMTDQVAEKEPGWAAEPALAPLAKVDLKMQRTLVVYHEIAHGYWPGVADGNRSTSDWIAEGMSEGMMLYALEQLNGPAAVQAELLRKQRKFQVGLARGQADAPLRVSYSDLRKQGQYSTLYYDKGGLFLDGLRRRVGDEAYLTGLRNALTRYRGQVMPDGEPVQAILDAAGNTPELQAYVHRWLDETHASEDLGPLPASALKLIQ